MHPTERKRRLRADAPDLIEAFGSPLYVFYERDLRENVRTLRAALDDHYPDSAIYFAVKANYNLGVLSTLRDAGCNAEAYARCELTATRRAGFDPEAVLLTGMNRTAGDLERALAWGVEYLLVDNATEAGKVADAAKATDTEPKVLVRGNPAMEVPTHPEVATATRESKFGLDIESGRAMAVARQLAESAAVRLAGVQLHVGSQVTGVEPYAVAAKAMVGFATDVRDELGVEIDVLDLGGGFPVPYDESVPDAEAIVARMARAVREGCSHHDLPEPTLFLEPGRRLVADAGVLLSTVGVVKETPHATFAVLDAGTNAVSSYWPYPIYALADEPATSEYHVAGPLCYSGDVLAEDVTLPELSRGDVLAIDRTGAYSLGSASHTNAEPKPAVVLVDESGNVQLIRARETCDDVLRNDRIPGHVAPE